MATNRSACSWSAGAFPSRFTSIAGPTLLGAAALILATTRALALAPDAPEQEIWVQGWVEAATPVDGAEVRLIALDGKVLGESAARGVLCRGNRRRARRRRAARP
jgi:hypothetical protein